MLIRVLAVFLLLALGSAAVAVAKPKMVRIGVADDVFKPATRTVKKGTKLKFVWEGTDLHNVIASGAATAKSKLQKTGTLVFTAKRKGTINLACEIHEDMVGTITVD
ncbi:MAG: Cupredoxin-like domain [Solirubrobacteraceae bacterium]|nr:Cupredoxin-like domain [Solirubrobacteraceae bacterium]